MGHSARTIVGIVGNVISGCLFISPMPTFISIIKGGAVGEFSPIPYLATIMNCALWVLYGLPFVHPDSTLVITINGAGLSLEICYTTIYLIYANTNQRLKALKLLAIQILFFAAVVVVTVFSFHTHKTRSMFVGVLSVIFGACMYASPLSIVKLVIETKSVEYMPFPLSLASFLNGVIWMVYALLQFDPYILTGNTLGAIFGAMQLMLYAMYYKSTPRRGQSAELQMSRAQTAV